MEGPKIDHLFFFSTFRLCDGQAKQAKRAIINIQKVVFQTAECGICVDVEVIDWKAVHFFNGSMSNMMMKVR
jgi:hypothetical protein